MREKCPFASSATKLKRAKARRSAAGTCREDRPAPLQNLDTKDRPQATPHKRQTALRHHEHRPRSARRECETALPAMLRLQQGDVSCKRVPSRFRRSSQSIQSSTRIGGTRSKLTVLPEFVACPEPSSGRRRSKRQQGAQPSVAQVEPAPSQDRQIDAEQHMGEERVPSPQMRCHRSAHISGQEYRTQH